jgi:DNA-directed RNA polymerase subunit RPC12/RpoP
MPTPNQKHKTLGDDMSDRADGIRIYLRCEVCGAPVKIGVERDATAPLACGECGHAIVPREAEPRPRLVAGVRS